MTTVWIMCKICSTFAMFKLRSYGYKHFGIWMMVDGSGAPLVVEVISQKQECLKPTQATRLGKSFMPTVESCLLCVGLFLWIGPML